MERQKIIQSLRKMREMAVPSPDIYGISPLQGAKMPGKLTPILRVFEPINFSKGRKPIAEFGGNFDKYSDVLSDSPVTIAAKLGKNWKHYNHHVIVQSSFCNFRCFYCYVDYKFLGKEMIKMSAKTILEQFMQKRKEAASKGQHYNVLRISGGEPMLVPDLTLSCLRMVRKLGLENEICIKTETNISPLVKVNGHYLVEEWADFDELAQFKNFLIHPTVHGISAENLQKNCGVVPEIIEMIFEGLEFLVKHRLDFYPSFGMNTVPLKDVEPFFKRIKEIHKNLPLRFAVRPFNFNYDAVIERKNDKRALQISEQNEVIKKWDALLQEEYGVSYAEKPRHKIRLDNDQSEYINNQAKLFQSGNQPAPSIDIKKKELIGDFKNRRRQSHVSKDIGNNK
jgi:uncharacterized Fe-S cluster-containing radical SAM superfamily protein